MRLSKLLAPTLRENPSEAEVVSHQLLMRAGYIRRLASGIYNTLPLMLRVFQKIETIIRQEMNRTGAQELLMPILQPADLWQESGRWEVYGKELIRLQDRHQRDCVLGPTHEEVICHIAKQDIHSYKQLPINLYQLQNKYRDEIRPRFGLLRGREFIMKDAYSFHANEICLDQEYWVMADAYKRIFKRCGLETRMVRSDSGAIGGDVSHEFMVLTNTHSGENDVFYCNTCDYAANGERAESILPTGVTDGSVLFPEEKKMETPNCTSIEELTVFLKTPATLIAKALLYIKDEKEPVLVFIRGDLEAEETKIKNASQALELRLATAEEVSAMLGTEKGYIGLEAGMLMLDDSGNMVFGRSHDCPPNAFKALGAVFFDDSVASLERFIIANNTPGYHTVGFNWPEPELIKKLSKTLRRARLADGCPECAEGKLQMTRGIEVGNIFKLGTKYSKAMSSTYTTENGEEAHFLMGCYGIGVSRTAAAAVEASHDEHGIIWPLGIAPFSVLMVPVNVTDEVQVKLAENLYNRLLEHGIDVLIDDRNERAGVKFKDADLMGFPIRITIGKRAAEGLFEVKLRSESSPQTLTQEETLAFISQQIAQEGLLHG
jgi:prolyl-tRNA synthetase